MAASSRSTPAANAPTPAEPVEPVEPVEQAPSAPSAVEPWLALAVDAINKLPTIEAGLAHLWQIMANEMQHGGGTKNPVAVIQAVLAATTDVAKALIANTSAADPS